MKRTLIAGLTALAGLGLFSCQNPASNTAPESAAVAVVDSVPANPHGGGGQPVSGNYITPCTQAYQTIMAQYGITTDSPAVPIKKCPTQTYRITLSESLTYTSLRHWLDSLALAIDPVGKGANVNIQIMPGICTQDFVTAMNQPASRVGRISYFLVPTLIDTSAGALKTRAAGGPPPPPPGGGVEVGGLEP